MSAPQRRTDSAEHLKAAGRGALADLGFNGVDTPEDPEGRVVIAGYEVTRARKLTSGQELADRLLPPDAPRSDTASRT